MYLDSFGLRERPFENDQDPRFFYTSAGHSEAVSRLVYACRSRKPLAVLTGDHGTGKTFVLTMLRGALDNNQFRLAHLPNPLLSVEELFLEVLRPLLDTGQTPEGKGEILLRLREAFVRNLNLGRHNVVLVDEAHLIQDPFVFEELRMLLNYTYNNAPLLTLLLCGQSDLRVRINRTPALRQRVAVSYNLPPLTKDETAPYLIHRIREAGFHGETPPFTDDCYALLHQHSGGLPRILNNVCDLALLMAAHQGLRRVDAAVLKAVFEEIPSRVSEASTLL